MANRIYFFVENVSIKLKNKNQLKIWLGSIIENEKYKLDCINFIFCSDNYLLNLNKQYLKHNTLTDIITFQYNANNEDILADVYISIERCSENANKLEIPFITELHRLLCHGTLHLCGYLDKKSDQKLLMTQKEDYYLSLRPNILNAL
jgi:probable rRNA maturation factor